MIASTLCLAARSVAVLLGPAAGVGGLTVTIVLIVNGTVTVPVGLAIIFLGLPLLAMVLELVNGVFAAAFVGIAMLVDRPTVEQWADSTALDEW